MKTILRILAPLALLATIVPATSAQSVIYVDGSSSGNDDGSSWQNAYTSLQDGLMSAASGDQIWIAAGTYTPHADDRSISFELTDGVRLHGGFAGNESALSERNISTNPTILSGDLAADDDGFSMRDDNTYHVVRIENAGENTLLEGLVIQGGHANGDESDSQGGGLLITGGAPAVVNTRFSGNYGRCGGAVAVTGSATPELVNVVINGNRALRGGGVCSLDADPTIVNATVTANTADSGAGVYNHNASPSIANSILSGNDRPGDIPECELMLYPCTIAEMSEELRARTLSILDEAYALRVTGDMASARAYLEQHEDVVEVLGDERQIRFRVRGGMPTWLADQVLSSEAGGPHRHGDSAEADHLRSDMRNRFEVVGEDSNGDGRIDNKDVKRAKILAPHEWDFGIWDESRDIRAALESIPEYQGRVEFKANPDSLDQNISLEDYADWDSYDMIYIATHGRRYCYDSDYYEQSRCLVRISSGIRLSVDEGYIRYTGIQFGRIYQPNPSGDVLIAGELLLTGQFFRNEYRDGLDNAVVIFGACETGGAFSDNLAADLGGDEFVMLGWSEVVDSDDANYASRRLLEEMYFGLSVEEALDVIELEGLRSVLNSDFVTTEFTRYAPNGGDQRIVELPIIQGDGGPLQDGTDITSMVDGAVGDDEPDHLDLTISVRGIVEDKMDDFSVRYVLDGSDLPGSYDLAESVMIDKYTYAVEHSVDLGYPLDPGSFKLEAIVDLPEGGESRYQADVTVGGCYWSLSISGAHAGDYGGNQATFVRNSGLFTGITLTDTNEPTPLVSLNIPLVPNGASGPYLLGEFESEGGSAQLNMTPVVTSPPFLYDTGNSEEILDNNVVVFTEPAPSTLTIQAAGSNKIAGFVTGTVFGLEDFSGASFDTADWTLEFQAENGLNPDGSPNFTACME